MSSGPGPGRGSRARSALWATRLLDRLVAAFGGALVTARAAWPSTKRCVGTPNSTGFAPAQVWKSSGVVEAVSAPIPLRVLNSVGSCVIDTASFTGTLFEFSPQPAPPDFQGPLRVK
jgi:hypothetical protein